LALAVALAHDLPLDAAANLANLHGWVKAL